MRSKRTITKSQKQNIMCYDCTYNAYTDVEEGVNCLEVKVREDVLRTGRVALEGGGEVT